MAITIFDPDERRRNNKLASLQGLQTFGSLMGNIGTLQKSQQEATLAKQQAALLSQFLPQLQGSIPGQQVPGSTPPIVPGTNQQGIGFKGFSMGPSGLTMDFGQTPEQKAALEQQSEKKKASDRIAQGLNTFKTLKQQFDKALPETIKKGDLPVFQRIEGALQKAGAKTGLVDNPQLVALSKMEVPATRMILKAMGEGARMSDQDIEQMIGSLDLAGLTSKERNAAVKLFFDLTSTQMDEETKNMFLNDPTIKDLFGSFSGDEKADKNVETLSRLGLDPNKYEIVKG